MYRYSIETRILENKQEVILGNRRNGEWIKTTNEIVEFVDEYLKCPDHELRDFFDSFSKEDEIYLLSIIEVLKKIDIIVADDDDSDFKLDIENVLISLTARCNLTCKHCSMSATSFKNIDKLSYEDITRIIDQLAHLKVRKVTLTGGEPLIRNDFFEIIKYIKENTPISIGIMTNATLINEKNIDELVKYSDSLDISIDGVNEDTCSVIRGKGVFNRVISAVKMLKDRKYKNIALSMTETPNNAPFVDRFYDLCRELDVFPAVREFEYIGRAVENKEDLSKVYSTNLIPNSKSEISINVINNEAEMKKNGSRIKMGRCGALRKSLSINENGFIFPCSLLNKDEDILGSIFDIDLRRLFVFENITELASYKKLEKLEEYPNNACSECNVKYFCLTCPHVIEMTNNDKTLGKNNFCNGRKEHFTNIVWGNNY
ncbi:radical SAM protein [Paenibacillus albidus]|uniref:radical SAM/SPASM domain-containing protein n=1 Tax=Paenibacillus albidus TaxID=2041023 RepID=UPI001BE59306|nr:radical SAM protein [Paenibacillus albidus]MBT2291474.1 radical SAM protein [Paenibacillus albidus]